MAEKRSISKTEKQLLQENEKLRSRLSETEEILNAIRNGEVDAIVVNGSDGDKLYSLSTAETPYRIILEEMNEGAVTLSPDGTILYCNKKFAELVLTPMEQIVGSNFSRFVTDADMNKFRELLQSGLKDRSVGEIIHILKDGSPRHLLLSFRSLPSHMFCGVCVLTTDITKIKLVKEKLRKTNEKLMAAQRELIHNEKLAALGRFSSGIAHEIRNPLANISALSQLLSRARLGNKLKRHIKYILVNADIANNIIKDLLTFASPEDLDLKVHKIQERLEDVLGGIEPRCMERNVTITRSISKDLPKVYLDKIKFDNAMMNFLSNALDAMPDGGELKVSAFRNRTRKEIIIEIADTGIGISPENLDKVLEPFYTTKVKGTGLGLGMAYQTISGHGGSVKIESVLNVGTTVRISLPAGRK